MKKYIWFIWVVIIGYLVSTIKQIYTITIMSYRYKARIVVYEYSNSKKHYIHKLKYKISNKHNVIKYYIYLLFIWIWLDDSLNRDILDTEVTYNTTNKNISTGDINTILKDLNKCGSNKYVSFEDIGKGMSTIVSTVTSRWLTIIHNSNTNFKWKYHYTTDRELIFNKKIGKYNIGWVLIEERPYNVNVYKITIGSI